MILTIFVALVLNNTLLVSANTENINDKEGEIVSNSAGSNKTDWNNLIPINNSDFTNINYIDNANYFFINPLHNENVQNDDNNGTCTTVAMQLLMSYHNFYTDGRLIPTFDNNGDRYLSENYGNLAEHPKVNTVKNDFLGKESLGTLPAFYTKLMNLNNMSDNETLGQAIPFVANSARNFINNYSGIPNNEVDMTFFTDNIMENAKSEIDAGRPTILAGKIQIVDGKFSAHVVVAYGYATYNDEEGFIVHSGWQGNSSNVWYPASWFGYQLKMTLDHEHDFVNDFDVYDNAYRKLKCNTCGCVDLDYIYDVSSDGTSIIGANYDLTGSITIPEVISGKSISSIGENAFKNQSGITKVIINDNISNIGSNSFEGCSALADISIDCSSSIIIGSNVFDNCNDNLKICVDQYDYGYFASSSNWDNYINLIYPNEEFIEIILDCSIDNKILIKDINSGLIRLTVLCNRIYNFTSYDNVSMTLFNESMTIVENGCTYLSKTLYVGTYYFEIKPNIEEIYNQVILNYGLKYPLTGSEYFMEEQLDIDSYVHNTCENKKHGILFFTNNKGTGLYKLKLDCGNSYSYKNVKIKVFADYENDELVNKYDTSNVNQLAINIENENELFIYLKENCHYYVFIEYDYINLSSAIFTIETIEVKTYDYSNSMLNSGFCIVFENIQKTSYFEKVTFNQYVKIEMDIFTNINLNSLGKIYIFKEVKVPIDTNGAYDYALETIHISQIGSPDWLAVFTLILEPGTYYFGYDNNLNKTSVNFAFNRIIQYEECNKNILVADPKDNAGYVLGTEVLFNKGVLNGNTITQGFTRNIYLNVEDRVHDPMSRLEYSWYSSNENAAIVTSFGTVLALPVDDNTNVTIYAIRKSDPSVIYSKTFTILNYTAADFIKIEINLSYSYSRNNGTYKLELNSTNCPFPMIQYYIWDDFELENKTVTVGDWGHVTSNGVFEALIVGTYKLNPRVTLYINLNITE